MISKIFRRVIGMILCTSILAITGCKTISDRVHDDVVEIKKPVLYIYPECDNTRVDVGVNIVREYGEINFEYPSTYNGIWKCRVDKDSNISVYTKYDEEEEVFKGITKVHSLFWEASIIPDIEKYEWNYCIKGEEIVDFLEIKLIDLGLNQYEAAEFIQYWGPILQKNKYNLISFQTNYVDLVRYSWDIWDSVNGKKDNPDTFIRVFMVYESVDEPVRYTKPLRKMRNIRRGFTAVEWGGCEYPKG